MAEISGKKRHAGRADLPPPTRRIRAALGRIRRRRAQVSSNIGGLALSGLGIIVFNQCIKYTAGAVPTADTTSHRLTPVVDAFLRVVLALDQEGLCTAITLCDLVLETRLVAADSIRDVEKKAPKLQVFLGEDEMLDVRTGEAERFPGLEGLCTRQYLRLRSDRWMRGRVGDGPSFDVSNTVNDGLCTLARGRKEI
jgi:hypothetical protein